MKSIFTQKTVSLNSDRASDPDPNPRTIQSLIEFCPSLGEKLARERIVDRLFGASEPVLFGDNYEIKEEIGRGAMGLVLRAKDRSLGRDVALKILKDRSSGDEARLEREAKILAKIEHPNVVQIYAVGRSEEQFFIAMQFIGGKNLYNYLEDIWRDKQRRPPWQERLKIMLEAGEGLVAVHLKNLIHRDFKPANILISSDRHKVHVADFGLARPPHRSGQEDLNQSFVASSRDNTIADGDDTQDAHTSFSSIGTMTQPGAVAGTPRYMAPELW